MQTHAQRGRYRSPAQTPGSPHSPAEAHARAAAAQATTVPPTTAGRAVQCYCRGRNSGSSGWAPGTYPMGTKPVSTKTAKKPRKRAAQFCAATAARRSGVLDGAC
eukprot:2086011-Prymnesium_polylepis.2